MELNEIKGVGDKTVDKLNKLGIYTVEELYKFLPTNYLDMSKISNTEDIIEGNYSLLKVDCIECSALYSKSHTHYVKAICDCNGNRVEIIWFNMPYISKIFIAGEWLVWGKYTVENGVYTTINPSYANVDNKLKLHGVIPIYPLKGLIGATAFRKIMENTLMINDIVSLLPSNYDLNKLYKKTHFPTTIEQIMTTHYELAMYSIILDLIHYKSMRLDAKKDCRIVCEVGSEIISTLPYCLTDSQMQALKDIIEDINQTPAMNRLVLGDVGSGKTIVAMLAMYAVAKAGKQSVLMSPTEILCKQHYNTAVRLFGVDNVVMLMGSMAKESKKSVANGIYCGKYKIIIATQSSISKNLQYNDLGLVIIDESHKFGVSQKGKLENKGSGVNTLIMSATPLPRSLAMTLYEDLKISKIERRNENLHNIKSYVFNSLKLKKMFRYIADKANGGEKVYLICPRLNDNDGKEMFSVKSVYKHIIKDYLKPSSVAMLYGGIKDIERDSIMERFAHGDVNLLIATTVVEVGVDVPQANIMVILASDCFGLASLHQLRGRIGRSGTQAECFFHTRSRKIPDRIKAIKECSDGYKLAEIDAEDRGYGDIIGSNQSGKNKYEKFLCKVTLEMIKKAKQIADGINIENDTIKSLNSDDLTDIVLN